MNDRDPAALLRFVQQLVDETDAILAGHFAAGVAASHKADQTLVTAADTQVEAQLRSRLADAFPGDGFVGEEYGTDEGRSEARWIIDPIDATANFVRGIPIFGTLLALERAGELVLGIVSAPALGQRWWATAGQGAFTRVAGRERQIRVSDVDRLSEALLLFAGLGALDEAGQLAAWLNAVRGSWRDRGFGDFWGNVLVAQGAADVMLEEHGVDTWDLAAPHIIVSEAGGRMTDLRGRVSWSGPEALSTNGLLHEELLTLLIRGTPNGGIRDIRPA